MISPDNTTDTTTGPYERQSRTVTRREIINEKRQRQTETLPGITGETPAGKMAMRQVAHLREENKRLRWDLEDLEGLLRENKYARAQLEKEIAAVRSSHQLEIEQYQDHLRDMMEERNQMQELQADLERRYQELYRSFHEKVEEEATTLVSEAARTLVLSPDHTPPLLHDVVKTLEFQVKQTEDQHVAEILRLMRQAQHKAELLEQEIASERVQIDEERQNLIKLQNSVREQAQLRYKSLNDQFRSRWFTTLAFLMTFVLLALSFLQFMLNALGLPVYILLSLPFVICIVLAYFLARSRIYTRLQVASKQSGQKATIKLPNPKMADKPALKTSAKKS
ncbi:MAG TPA: hypothetical protein VF043_37620 [Ktedonobacteraceae bacterium]